LTGRLVAGDGDALSDVCKAGRDGPLRLMTKKEKTGFFLLCSKQAKINALIFLIFYCTSSILSATG
jgi:hypothetical protein